MFSERCAVTDVAIERHGRKFRTSALSYSKVEEFETIPDLIYYHSLTRDRGMSEINTQQNLIKY